MKSINIEPYFIEKPWGGNFISEIFNLPMPRIIGEALLLSTLELQENQIQGENLSARLGEKLPFLIKLIDANENLSIQVHPNDHFARLLEKSVGKTECWIIIDSKEGAGIYYGFRPGVTLDFFFENVRLNKDISSLMNFIPVKKNDFIVVPAGTIHAIGSGIRLIEFQQASGVTYRIWDWDRGSRELHIEKAIMVSNAEQEAPKIVSLGDIKKDEYLLKESDFSLKKVNEETLCCFSDSTKTKAFFDLRNYTSRLE